MRRFMFQACAITCAMLSAAGMGLFLDRKEDIPFVLLLPWMAGCFILLVSSIAFFMISLERD